MRSRGWRGLPLLGVLVLLVLAGCGVSGTQGAYGSGGTSPTATANDTGPAPGAGIVATATASVGGKSASILTDAHGRTLYYFDDDTSSHSACTTGCTDLWPPLLVSSGAPTSTSSLPGTLSALDVGNGMQVLYNGHPLYRFSNDSAAGQTNGDGYLGKWHVATPTVATNSGATNTPATGQATPTVCSGYYCYNG